MLLEVRTAAGNRGLRHRRPPGRRRSCGGYATAPSDGNPEDRELWKEAERLE